jgi:hypothetical protein
MPDKNYTYYDFTLSLCSECLRRVTPRSFSRREGLHVEKLPEHGFQKVIIATDVDKNIRNYKVMKCR